MLKKYAQNKTERFHCESCDYKTSKKSSWNQHLATRKHMNATKCYINATNAIQKYALVIYQTYHVVYVVKNINIIVVSTGIKKYAQNMLMLKHIIMN